MLTIDNLYSWQRAAIIRAAAASVLIAAAPGAGKTPVLLSAARRAGVRALLVAPRPILDSVYEAEAANWQHLADLRFLMAHRLSGAEREAAWFSGDGDIVTCTPDTLSRFVEALLDRRTRPIGMVLVDESQLFKNPTSTRSRALLALASIVPHVVLASGTPSPNGPINSWMPGRVTAPTEPMWAAEHWAWRSKHFDRQGMYGWRPKAGATKVINETLAKASIAIRLSDTTDVPRALYSKYPFAFSPKHTERINDFMRDCILDIEGVDFGSGDADDAGSYLMRLQQLSHGFAYRDGPQNPPKVFDVARVDALEQIADSVDGPVLVAARFKADVSMIRSRFPKAAIFGGSTPADERVRIIKDWNADKIEMLVGNPLSMGHGLNLQLGSARTIVWYAGSFSYEQFTQFNARLVRGGQKKVISIVSLAATVGIDNAIESVLKRKSGGEAELMRVLLANGGDRGR